MSKNPNRTPSVSERRKQEEARRQKEKQRNLIIGGVAVGLLAILALVFFLNRDGGDGETTGTELTGDRPLATLAAVERVNYYDAAPEMIIDTEKDYQAIIRMENGGEMVLDLFDDESPATVNNFVYLANQGYYDGTTFHRVLADFMAQAGDPTGTGTGGPGYMFADETENGLSFDRRGLLAMANSGADTNGSQFFITFTPTPHLDGAHTIFGELVEGDDVLSSLTLRNPETDVEPGDVISEIVIVEQ